MYGKWETHDTFIGILIWVSLLFPSWALSSKMMESGRWSFLTALVVSLIVAAWVTQGIRKISWEYRHGRKS